MSEIRQSRGVALPRRGQVIALVASLGACWVLWTECRNQFRGWSPNFAPENASDRRRLIDSIVDRGPSATPDLLALLASSDANLRRDALLGMERLGPEGGSEAALSAVRLRLDDETPRVREYALLALARISADQDAVIAAAARQLVDSDPDVRETAARRLETMGSRVIPVLVELAGDVRPVARQLAIRILKYADRHRDPDEVTAVLRSLLDDPVPEVRMDAVSAVAARGAATTADVRGWLREGNPAIVEQGLLAVCALGPEAIDLIPELESLLDNDESPPRLAFAALGSLKIAGREALPRLLQRAESLADADRLSAAAALLAIGADTDQMQPILGPLVTEADIEVRIEAAALLVRSDPAGARRLADRLVAQLQADQMSLERPILSLLCALRPESSDSVSLLIRLISHKDPAVQTTALQGLERIGPLAAPAVPELVKLLVTPRRVSPQLRAAIRALGGIGPAGRPAVPHLLAILDQAGSRLAHGAAARMNGSGVETEAVWALGRIGDDSPAVLAAVRRPLITDIPLYYPQDVTACRVAAIQALALLDPGSKATLSLCLNSLDDHSWPVRAQAALAVGYLPSDSRQVVDPLAAALNDDEWIVQTSAALALGQIGPAAGRATPTLRKMCRDHRNSVPNRLRGSINSSRYLFVPGDEDLGSLSVAAAARAALALIERPRTDDVPGHGTPRLQRTLAR